MSFAFDLVIKNGIVVTASVSLQCSIGSGVLDGDRRG